MNQLPLNAESLTFKLGISGTYWGKKPQYEILINDDLQAKKEISGSSNQVEYTEFTYLLKENEKFSLNIRLINKDSSDTILDNANGRIIKDLLLNIESIEIDGIELEFLKWTASKFVGDDSNKPKLDCCVNLGWNGTYSIELVSPFYLWLLENS